MEENDIRHIVTSVMAEAREEDLSLDETELRLMEEFEEGFNVL